MWTSENTLQSPGKLIFQEMSLPPTQELINSHTQYSSSQITFFFLLKQVYSPQTLNI